MTMHLCGASLSPYFERGNIVARLKDVGAETIKLGDMPCEMKSPAHFAFNPTGRIPFLVLSDGRESLIESQVIAEYLDAVLPGVALLPSTPQARAEVQAICRIIDLYLAPVVERCWGNRGFDDSEKARAVAEDLPLAWDYLEHLISDTGYAYGDGFTLADCALIPWLFHFERFVAPWGDWGVGERPRLINWLAHAGSSAVAQQSAERSQKSFSEFMKARRGEASA